MKKITPEALLVAISGARYRAPQGDTEWADGVRRGVQFATDYIRNEFDLPDAFEAGESLRREMAAALGVEHRPPTK